MGGGVTNYPPQTSRKSLHIPSPLCELFIPSPLWGEVGWGGTDYPLPNPSP